MPVGGQLPGVVEVVDQGELPDQRVLVRRDLFAELHQRRVAVAPDVVAEDLVVGPVLLDDVDDVLDRRRLADVVRDRLSSNAFARPVGVDRVPAVVHADLRDAGGEDLCARGRHERQAPHVRRSGGAALAVRGAVRRADVADALAVDDHEGALRLREGAGVPPGRQQALEGGGLAGGRRGVDGDGVVPAEGHSQPAVLEHRQPVGVAAVRRSREGRHRDLTADRMGVGVDDGHRVGVGVRDVQAGAVQGHGRRVQADGDLRGLLASGEVDDADPAGARGPVHRVRHDRGAVAVVGVVVGSGAPATLVGDISGVAVDDHAVRGVADVDAAGQGVAGDVDDAELVEDGVGDVDLAVIGGEGQATGVGVVGGGVDVGLGRRRDGRSADGLDQGDGPVRGDREVAHVTAGIGHEQPVALVVVSQAVEGAGAVREALHDLLGGEVDDEQRVALGVEHRCGLPIRAYCDRDRAAGELQLPAGRGEPLAGRRDGGRAGEAAGVGGAEVAAVRGGADGEGGTAEGGGEGGGQEQARSLGHASGVPHFRGDSSERTGERWRNSGPTAGVLSGRGRGTPRGCGRRCAARRAGHW